MLSMSRFRSSQMPEGLSRVHPLGERLRLLENTQEVNVLKRILMFVQQVRLTSHRPGSTCRGQALRRLA